MLEVKDLTKYYKGCQLAANQNISFSLAIGEVVGLLGRNGAGKTTLIRQLLGLLQPSSGTISGCRPEDLAYVPQIPVFFPALTVGETIRLNFKCLGLSKSEQTAKYNELIAACKLEDLQHSYVYQLSGGAKKLVLLACSLALEKPYLILDEPTAMLDIHAKKTIWELIAREKARRGILLASHDLTEVQALCDRVLVMREGTIGQNIDLTADFFDGAMVTTRQGDHRQEQVFASLTDALAFAQMLNEQDENIAINLVYPLTVQEAAQNV